MNKRPVSSYLIAIGSVLLGALALVQAIWYSSASGVRAAAIICLLLSLIWVSYVLPKVELTSDQVLISNPFTISRVGFGAIDEVDTRFALKLISGGKSVSAWAAPAPGRHRHRSHSPEDFKLLGVRGAESVRPGDLPASISGSFAFQIRQRIETGATSNTDFETRPNWLNMFIVLLPLAATVLTHL